MKITDKNILDLGYEHKYKLPLKSGNHTKEYWQCWDYKKGRRQFEHILIYQTYVGPIPKGYVIHHIDGDGLNNSIDNLQCLSRAEHMMIHGKKIWIDGKIYTLDQVMELFDIKDKGNCIRALKRATKNGKPHEQSKFYGHEVKYEKE